MFSARNWQTGLGGQALSNPVTRRVQRLCLTPIVSFLSSAIFTPKVTSGPSLFSFLLLHQTDKLSPQKFFWRNYYHTDFFPIFLHNFRALSESKLLIKNVLSVQPFPTFPRNTKIALNSNIHRSGKTFPNFATDDIIYIGPLILIFHCLFHLISQK